MWAGAVRSGMVVDGTLRRIRGAGGSPRGVPVRPGHVLLIKPWGAQIWIGTCFSAHASTTAATMSWVRNVSRSSTVTEPLSVRCWAATRESRSRSARSTTLRAKRPFCITSIPWLPSGARWARRVLQAMFSASRAAGSITVARGAP